MSSPRTEAKTGVILHPYLPINDFFKTATFLCPQGGRSREARLYLFRQTKFLLSSLSFTLRLLRARPSKKNYLLIGHWHCKFFFKKLLAKVTTNLLSFKCTA